MQACGPAIIAPRDGANAGEPRTRPGWGDAVTAACDRAPGGVLAAILAVHVALWGLVPALSQRNLPLDVIEQLAWGREWQWAYFKHPPLPAWILETAASLTGGSAFAMFFVGPLASALALFFIWRLARDLLGVRSALLAVLVQEGVLYFTFFTPEFNHNVVQLPLWAAIAWTTWLAIRGNRPVDWLIAGGCAGLGMLGKYATGILLLALAGFILIEPTARRRLRTRGPWLAIGASLIVLAPHILALAKVHYGPLLFPFQRAATGTSWDAHLALPLRFASAQFLDILPALLLLAFLARGPRDAAVAPAAVTFDRRYAATLCLAPVAICLAVSGVFALRLKDMWGTPLWDYVGLYGVMMLPAGVPRIGPRFAAAWVVVLLLGPLAYAVQFPGQALFGHKPLRGQFPGQALARAIDVGWHLREGPRPLRYVVGDVWIAGNIAFDLWRERPSVLIDGDYGKSPWVTPADIACHGAVLVWQVPGPQASLATRFANAQRQPAIELSYQTWTGRPAARFGWAVVPPRNDCDRAGRGEQ